MHLLSPHWALGAAIWYTGNGLLHDIFVLVNHKGRYNRDLLRLLMDGHVLIFFGLILFVAWHMMRQQVPYGAWIGLIVAASMIVYCGMIFPFLKSFITLFISIMLAAVSLYALNTSGPLTTK